MSDPMTSWWTGLISYVQAVLLAATRTDIREWTGINVDTLPVVIKTEDMVDAALVSFDRHEPVKPFRRSLMMLSGAISKRPAEQYRRTPGKVMPPRSISPPRSHPQF
jgi:hypothetical protein